MKRKWDGKMGRFYLKGCPHRHITSIESERACLCGGRQVRENNPLVIHYGRESDANIAFLNVTETLLSFYSGPYAVSLQGNRNFS